MGNNPVLESTKFLINNPKHVFIDYSKLTEIAKIFAEQELELPKWDLPVHTSEKDNNTIDFFFLQNSINFAFTDFKTKEKFSTKYNDIEWKGALGMVGCLKKAIKNNIPILNADYLKNIQKKDMEQIFSGNFEIPMLNERLKIFKEVGKVLTEKYDGHFYNLVEASNNKLFNNGNGLIEKLIKNFPSFDDSAMYKGKKVIFNKRAQLAGGMIYEKFLPEKKLFKDIDKLTIFADYVLPKGLRDMGILNYDHILEEKVDNQKLIKKNSREELEIRASTIHIADILIKRINKLRNNKNKINALHIDYKLWSESRKYKEGKPHHLTKTIAY